MNGSKKNKKAFTLMEIGISLLIMSILVMLCIPIVTKQMKKTDEYAYYAAFKTVEKMGSQIVAFGDPEGLNPEIPDAGAYNIDSSPFTFKDYIANYSNIIFKTVFPNAYAAIQTSEIVSFPSYEYDYVRICLGNTHVVKDYDVHAGNLWSEEEIQSIQNEPLCKNIFSKDDFIKKRFMCPNMSLATVKNLLATTSDNASDYCKWLSHSCSGAHDCTDATNNNKKSCYKHIILSQSANKATYGECIITIKDPDLLYQQPSLPAITNNATLHNATCDKYGFSGMTEYPDTLCKCNSISNPVSALNNKNICCPTPPDGKYPYYAGPAVPCLNCEYEAFNETSKTCCPANSFYSKSLGKCVCAEGYTPDNADSPTLCSISDNTCPAGSHLVDNKCISNSPIISAKRFCELVSYYWNVTNHSCDTFTDVDGVTYYKDLYDSITDGDTSYLSAKAVNGAFNNVEPNVVFANGLRMWILGDRSASIAGLSFNPDDYTPSINVCKLKPDTSAQNCTTEPDFYCKTDDKCFTINQGNGSLKLGDSRNCCSSADFTDLIHLYEGDHYLRDPRTYAINGFTVFIDINGTKDNDEMGGGGTLWKDVFPFYISSNGHVYPAYPLNAAKVGDNETTKDSSSLFQGGNSSALTADVFYYTVENGKRKKINVYPAIPYARALCFSMEISINSPYCRNLGSKFRHSEVIDNPESAPCYHHRCFLKLKNKIKFL